MSVISIRNTHQEIAGKELRASRVNWKRLRRLALYCGLLAGAVSVTSFYMNSGFSGLLLRADGHVTRDQVAVASAFDGRLAEIFVRPGDHVEKGQKIAIVKSVAVGRTLADLEAEKARLSSKIAELEARQKVIGETMPLAKSNAEQAATYLGDLRNAQAGGLVVHRSMQEMTAASLAANEHEASLQAEQSSLSAELTADRTALEQATSAYNDLAKTYDGGALYASVSGDIGATVAPVGQALSTVKGTVADIFTGNAFVQAYLPESYLFDVAEGQPVTVRARNDVLTGRIEKILPLDENLPTDLQRPNRMLDRGQLVRIALPASSNLAIDQRVRVAGTEPSQIARSFFGRLYQIAASLTKQFA